jgi:DNA-binding Lrp family transcriptional regulator
MTQKLKNSDTISIDDKDAKILNELISNAKIPLRDLAKKLSISFITVRNRIKRLESQGIIKGYTIKIDYEKLGYGTHVLIEIRISKGKLIELEQKIGKHPNVYVVYDTTGEFDATIVGWFNSTRQMDAFLKKIQSYEFVERTNTKLILHSIKEEEMKL